MGELISKGGHDRNEKSASNPWGRKFSDFWVSRDSKWEDSRLRNQKVVVY